MRDGDAVLNNQRVSALMMAARLRGATDPYEAISWMVQEGYLEEQGSGAYTLTRAGVSRAVSILGTEGGVEGREPDDEFTDALLSDLLALARHGRLFRRSRMRAFAKRECARRGFKVPAKVRGFLDGAEGL